jgi:DnaJ-domain-containing protein 1
MPRVKNPNKPKRGFLDGYETYNPEVEGFGSSFEWSQAFKYRMGLDVAKARMDKKTPRGVLGVSLSATWEEIKKAYRKLAVELYPEKRQNAQGEWIEHGDNEKFLDVQAAYEVLENEHERNKR